MCYERVAYITQSIQRKKATYVDARISPSDDVHSLVGFVSGFALYCVSLDTLSVTGGAPHDGIPPNRVAV